jgi:hypothetical protein
MNIFLLIHEAIFMQGIEDMRDIGYIFIGSRKLNSTVYSTVMSVYTILSDFLDDDPDTLDKTQYILYEDIITISGGNYYAAARIYYRS